MRFRLFRFAILVFLGLLALAFIYQHYHSRKPVSVPAKPEEAKVTFIEGWTNQDIANYLEKQNLVTSKDFLTTLNKFDLSSYPTLAFKPEKSDLQGFLFPDTYFVLKKTTSDAVIKKALDNFVAKWAQATGLSPMKNGEFTIPGYSKLTLSPYQVLILASIIEKETGNSTAPGSGESAKQLQTDRETVASVFLNRLSINMALESDATVNFVTGKSDAAATSADTSINSPYNTYKYRGLPPGPICNPSLSSLESVLNPANTDYMYFLSVPSTGQLVYSKTLAEHNAQKQKYLK